MAAAELRCHPRNESTRRFYLRVGGAEPGGAGARERAKVLAQGGGVGPASRGVSPARADTWANVVLAWASTWARVVD